jgi:hypothetical protein
VSSAKQFARWTVAAVDQQCAEAHDAYKKTLHTRHLDYFRARPKTRDPRRPWAASARRYCFPEGWEKLATILPEESWQEFHLFGGSSQTLAITLLTAAVQSDPTLSWVPGAETLGSSKACLYEVELAPHVLNEQPCQTTIDWLLLGSSGVIAAEAKYRETGFGTCRCDGRAEGICSDRVLERPYWQVAGQALGLHRDEGSGRCALSVTYQAVRNIAAASTIARGRRAGLLLLYDARNPYFSGCGEWPGWVSVVGSLCAASPVDVRTLAWQELLDRLPLDHRVIDWALEKHGLDVPVRTR